MTKKKRILNQKKRKRRRLRNKHGKIQLLFMQQEDFIRDDGKKSPLPLLRKQDAFQRKVCDYQDQGKMNYSAEIKIKEDPEKVYIHLLPESKEKKDRSHFTLKKTEKEVIVEVEAKDAVAFRATMNAITQLLSVFHKMRGL